MNDTKVSNGEIKISLDDLYSLLFSLNMNSDNSEGINEQIESIERIIAYNLTRKDVPAYSLQQTIELSEDDAENILRDRKSDFIKLNDIRQKLSTLAPNLIALAWNKGVWFKRLNEMFCSRKEKKRYDLIEKLTEKSIETLER